MKPAAALFTCFLASILPLAAQVQGQSLKEDFSKMANGRKDTNENKHGDLGDKGADLNGWKGRSFNAWIVEKDPKKNANVLTSSYGPATWKVLGKEHGLKIGDDGGVELSMRLAEFNDITSYWIWICDKFQNGYGIRYETGHQVLQVIKITNGKLTFDPTTVAQEWKVEESPSAKVKEKIAPGAVVDIFVRIKPKQKGEAVSFAAWIEDSNRSKNGSASSPLIEIVESKDKGLGSGAPSPVHNLKTLDWLAFSGVPGKEQPIQVQSVEIKAIN